MGHREARRLMNNKTRVGRTQIGCGSGTLLVRATNTRARRRILCLSGAGGCCSRLRLIYASASRSRPFLT